MAIKYCAQCKANAEAADDPNIGPELASYYVQGTRPDYYTDRPVPYRAYLCEDHLEIELQDGANFTVQRKLNQMA